MKDSEQTVPIFGDAYDLAKVRAECRELALPARTAIAWLDREVLYSTHLPLSLMPPPGTVPASKFVNCIECYQGDAWRIWDEETVCDALMAANGQETIVHEPVVDTIFDPAIANNAWYGKAVGKDRKDCLNLAANVLEQAAKLRGILIDLKDAMPAVNFERVLWFLDQSENVAEEMKGQIGLMVFEDTPLDASTAFLLGVKVGGWLAKAQAVLENEPSREAMSYMRKGKPVGRFWTFIETDPMFDGKNPKEILDLLGGLPDPDSPGEFIKIGSAGEVIRLNRKPLSLASFLSTCREVLARKRRQAEN